MSLMIVSRGMFLVVRLIRMEMGVVLLSVCNQVNLLKDSIRSRNLTVGDVTYGMMVSTILAGIRITSFMVMASMSIRTVMLKKVYGKMMNFILRATFPMINHKYSARNLTKTTTS